MEESQHVGIRMESKNVQELDRIAAKCGISRSQLIRNLLLSGIEEARMLEKVGALQAMRSIRDLTDWLLKKQPALLEDDDKEVKA